MTLPPDTHLPVHGFVLGGGKSSRMGRDKALLSVGGRPMVEIAVEKLRSFCAHVTIVGNRDDLRHLAPVVPDAREGAGPIAGIEAGLRATLCAWALFTPVDVPLVPAALLPRWAHAVLARSAAGARLSFLRANGHPQPAFCLLHRDCAGALSAAAEAGSWKLGKAFAEVASALGPGTMWVADAEALPAAGGDTAALDLGACFANINSPEDLAALESSDAPDRSGVLRS